MPSPAERLVTVSYFQVVLPDAGTVRFEQQFSMPQEQFAGEPQAPLPAMFMLARRCLDWLTSTAHRFEVPVVFGHFGSDVGPMADVAKLIESAYPIPLVSPFEGCDSIAGGVCSGKGALGTGINDALAKLRFEAGTVELPIHVHEHSDRFIVVADGRGTFYYAPGDLKSFDGTRVVSMPVKRGDVILFLRNVLHTFGAAADGLMLYSYHAPEISFDDRRQYALPEFLWYPGLGEIDRPPLSGAFPSLHAQFP